MQTPQYFVRDMVRPVPQNAHGTSSRMPLPVTEEICHPEQLRTPEEQWICDMATD